MDLAATVMGLRVLHGAKGWAAAGVVGVGGHRRYAVGDLGREVGG